jgi:hypothetical protein
MKGHSSPPVTSPRSYAADTAPPPGERLGNVLESAEIHAIRLAWEDIEDIAA